MCMCIYGLCFFSCSFTSTRTFGLRAFAQVLVAVTTVETVLLLAATAFMSSLCPFVAAQWTLHFLHAQFHVFLLLSLPGPVLNLSVILVLSQKQQGK